MKNFNELFKKKLAEQQFDGKEKYWAELEKKLTESAQEKVVIAWYKKWLLPMLAFVVVGASAIILTIGVNSNSNADIANNTIETKEQTSSAQEVETLAKTKNGDQTMENVSNQSQTISNNEVYDNTSKQSVTNNEDNAKINSSVASTSGNNLSNSTSNNLNKSSIVKTVNHKTPENPSNAITKAKSSVGKEPVLSYSDREDNNAFILANNTNSVHPKTIANEIATTETIQNTNDEYASTNTNLASKALDFSQVEMPLAYLSPLALSKLIYPVTTKTITANIIPMTPAKAKNKLNISVYSGAMLSMKNILTSDGNTPEYISRRKNEEASSIKPNAGIDIELKRGHWTFTSGLNFHQQGDKRNYSNQFKRMLPYDSLVININDNSAWLVDSTMFYALQYNNIITSIDTTITYYDETSGLFYTAQLPVTTTQSTIIDTNYYYLIDSTYNSAIDTLKTNYALKKQVVVNDPDQANLKGRNTFTYIEAPLLIGYEWGIRRWRLSLKGGIGVGVLTRQQSFYLTSDEAEIAPVSTDVYTKIMYNGILRAGLHYNFTPQFGIDFVPFSRLNINNMTNKNATFQQKYTNIGLQVGLNYKL